VPKAVQTKTEPKFAANFPTDLGRVAGKGMDAIESFLDLSEDVSDEEFGRAATRAKIGCVAFGGALRFLQARNNANAIALAAARIGSEAPKAIE